VHEDSDNNLYVCFVCLDLDVGPVTRLTVVRLSDQVQYNLYCIVLSFNENIAVQI